MTDVSGPFAKVFGSVIEVAAAATSEAVNDTILGATKATGSKIGQDLRLISKAWTAGYLDFDERIAMHRRVAKFAQAAMVASYDENHRRKASRTPDTRFARGALRKALMSRAFYEATPDGVIFGRASYLDRVAKQWYRMNFGVGAAGVNTKPGGSYVVKLFTQSGTILSLAQFRPGQATDLPAGMFFTSGGAYRRHNINRVGADSFHIFNKNSPEFSDKKVNIRRKIHRRNSRGHEGLMFMDAGIKALAEAFGLEWTAFSLKIFEEAAKQDSGPIAQYLTQEESANANRRIRTRAFSIRGNMAEFLLALKRVRGEI